MSAPCPSQSPTKWLLLKGLLSKCVYLSLIFPSMLHVQLRKCPDFTDLHKSQNYRFFDTLGPGNIFQSTSF
jgi:hypothetical protein